MSRTFIAVLGAVIWTAAVGLTEAPANVARVEIGTLTCMLGPKSTEPATPEEAGERRGVICRFAADEKAPGETYTGTLQMVGPTAQLPDAATIVMVAKAPSSLGTAVGPIHQKYAVGAKTEGRGQPPPLIGERNSSIVLHPLTAGREQPSLALGQRNLILIGLELRLETAPA